MESQPGALRLRPMGVSDLIDTVFSLYRRNFWLLRSEERRVGKEC
jgi:hypothetical protein